jgi:hypothetical protein
MRCQFMTNTKKQIQKGKICQKKYLIQVFLIRILKK